MPHGHHRRLVAFALLLVAFGEARVLAAPAFTLTPDGTAFLYPARPGDSPGRVAEMFGIPPQRLAEVLAANGIADPTRVGAGFVYRIPNPVATRASELAAENARLAAATRVAEERAGLAEQSARTAENALAQAEARIARLARYERLWTVVRALAVVLALGIVGAIALAGAAVRRQQRATRWARSLAQELEEKRRAGLVERQESARRVLELETKVRALETKLAPRVVISGRSA